MVSETPPPAGDEDFEVDLRPPGLVARLFTASADARFVRVVAAFVVASAAHLWLADAAQADWATANAIYVVGLILLAATRGAAVGWIGCAAGLAIPLWFHRDQLTQSMLLLLVCAAGTWAMTRRAQDVRGFLRTVQGLTLATYLFAAFHKLNRDFFDPAVGCTTYGLREIAEYYRLDPAFFDVFAGGHAYLAVALELAIPLAYLWGRRDFARVLAVVFHIPLTLTMAPAFAFVMAVGHAAFVTPGDAERLAAVLRRDGRRFLLAAVLVTSTSLLAHGAWPEWTMVPREAALWFALFWFTAAWIRTLRAGERIDTLERAGKMPMVVVGIFVLNCLTPYLGLQFQHAGAMLSNLRIDRGCWNHLVMPEALRVRDDYVRVDRVVFGRPGNIPDYEQTVLEQLWSPPQFRQMRRNWCRPEIRPFALEGEFRGRRFAIHDLCDDASPWPFEDDGIFGVELFDGYLRFQKNLLRACPQACIH